VSMAVHGCAWKVVETKTMRTTWLIFLTQTVEFRCVERECVLLLLGLGLVTEKVVRNVRESVLSIIDMVCPGCFEESHSDRFTIALMDGLSQNCIGP